MSAVLSAVDNAAIGPAALGMGGSRVASVDDATAVFVNPAVLGFMSRGPTQPDAKPPKWDHQSLGPRKFGVDIFDVTGAVAIHGQLGDYLNRLDEVDFNKFQTLGQNPTANDLRNLVEVASVLQTFTPETDFVTADVNVGLLNVRAWHFGIGFRQHLHAAAQVTDIDRTNIGIDLSAFGGDINAAFANLPGPPSGYMPEAFTSAQQATLGSAGLDAAAIAKLDYASKQAGLSASEIAAIVGSSGDPGILTRFISQAGVGTWNNNTTAIIGQAVSVSEIPLGFGYAVNDWLAIGGAVKLMLGRVGAVKVRLATGSDKLADQFKDAMDDATKSMAFGIDVGVMARGPLIQAGLIGRNLNSPRFDGGHQIDSAGARFSLDDVTLKPQATLGLAFIPCSWLTIEADIDLNPATAQFTNYEIQNANIGFHLDPLRFLEFRGGISTNLKNSDIGPKLHAGIALDLYVLRWELAAAIATKTTTIDGSEYPREFSISTGLASEF